MGFKSIALATSILFLTTSVTAATVTHGYLTTDDTTDFILDTNTGRQYLRFDAYSLNYADTVLAVSAGGVYEGWSIATSETADEFYSSVLGTATTPCSGAVSYGTICGTVTGWLRYDFGISYSPSFDLFAYLSTQDTPLRSPVAVGLGQIHATGEVRDYDDWLTIADADNYVTDPNAPVNFLLYREAVVPIPSAVWLFGSGLIGLIGLARHKNLT